MANRRQVVITSGNGCGGPRLGEAIGLSLTGLELSRRVIRINRSKGEKDREVPLSRQHRPVSPLYSLNINMAEKNVCNFGKKGDIASDQ